MISAVESKPSVTCVPLRGRRFQNASKDPLTTLASQWTVPSFVAGEENRRTAAVIGALLSQATRDAEEGQDRFLVPSPVVVVGPSGSGKTHLVRGVAEAWFAGRKEEEASVVYLTASDFRRQLATAIDERQLASFRQSLRRCRLLALDDLDHLPPAGHLQQELKHTIDAITEAGGSCLFSSAKPVASLSGLTRGLISRLTSGVTLELSPLGTLARRELARQMLRGLGWEIEPAGLDLLAIRLPNDAPRLFQVLLEIRRLTSGAGALDSKSVETLLSRIPTLHTPPAREIIRHVSKRFRLPMKKLTGPTRKQSVVQARAIAIFLIREMTPLSYDQIGQLFGGRDHTTIMHNYRRIDRATPNDRALRSSLEDLRSEVAKL